MYPLTSLLKSEKRALKARLENSLSTYMRTYILFPCTSTLITVDRPLRHFITHL